LLGCYRSLDFCEMTSYETMISVSTAMFAMFRSVMDLVMRDVTMLDIRNGI